MKYKAIKGTRDLLPEEMFKKRYVENVARKLFESWGYLPILTPVFEQTELFVRSIGETTDIVQKEMYTFLDRKGRSLTLRPEGTAPIVRAYLENKLKDFRNPTKLYYFMPMFRYERPQKGRLREFHQIGLEVLGVAGPDIDAEVIAILATYFDMLGLSTYEVRVNTIGCRKCRASYTRKLRKHLKESFERLCIDCQFRYKANPMRAFDCKNRQCRSVLNRAPRITDYICDECQKHFEGVKHFLNLSGTKFVVDKGLVRGFDYYEKTTFEVVSPLLGAQSAIGAGGRYDPLIADCGGSETPGIGFAIGVERLLLQLEEENVRVDSLPPLDIYVCFLGEDLLDEALRIVFDLRRKGLSVDMDYTHRSLKGQFKVADRLNAKYVVIVAPEEQEIESVKVRNMASGEEKIIKKEMLIKDLMEIIPGG